MEDELEEEGGSFLGGEESLISLLCGGEPSVELEVLVLTLASLISLSGDGLGVVSESSIDSSEPSLSCGRLPMPSSGGRMRRSGERSFMS